MKKLFIVVNVDFFFLSHRKEIALKAQQNEYDVTIIAKDTGRSNEIKKMGLNFINLPLKRSSVNPIRLLQTFIYLYRIYRKEKPVIVHHVGLLLILLGTIAARLAKTPGIVNAVSGLGSTFSQPNKTALSGVIIRLLRLTLNMNKGHQRLRMIFQNKEDLSLFTDNQIIKPEQACLIKGSGVNLKQFSHTPEPTDKMVKIVLTSRMIREKGIFILTDAAMLLKKKYKDKVQFNLIGGLDENPNAIKEDDLKRICDGDYIKWLGYRSDVLEWLKSCHIVVLPSYYKEGVPKSLIEACAVGRAIITTNMPGCKDCVINGYNGYLIPVKDANTLAERLEILINDLDLRKEMGENSRKLAEQEFSIDSVIEKHLLIYKDTYST